MDNDSKNLSPEETLANEIKSIKDGVSKQVSEVKEEIKSLQDFEKSKQAMEAKFSSELKSFKEEINNKAEEEKKSLVSEIEALKEKQKKSMSHVGGVDGENAVEHKNFKSFQDIFVEAIANRKMATFNVLNQESKSIFNEAGFIDLDKKALVTYDNSVGGQFVPESQRLGLLNVNLQTLSPITTYVNNISAGNKVAGDMAYDTLDAREVEIFEGNELTSAKNTNLVKYDEIKIYLSQYKARFQISEKMLHSVSELRFNPIQQMMQELERRFEKNIARNVLNGTGSGEGSQGVRGILPIAQKQARNNNIRVVDTAAVNSLTLQDLRNFGKSLKMDYIQNGSVLIMDKLAFYSISSEEGNDGHLKEEYFVYNNTSGVVSLKTPSGAVPIVLVEQEDGFINYPSFNNGSNVTEGFVSGATNTGKAVAILGNLRRGYTLARSSVTRSGYDDSISQALEAGYVYAGKYGYVGGNVTIAESMAVLKIK